MNPFSVDIKDLIESSSGFSQFVSSENLFVGHEPDDPDLCITIYDTLGLPPDQEIDPSENFTEHPACQVRVRSNSYLEAYDVIRDVIKLLKILPQDLGGACYGAITQVGTISSIGLDERNRTRLTANFMTIREEIA